MPSIVEFPTKKALKEAIQNNKDFWIEDPSFVNPNSCMASELVEGQSIFVTNHPKRSWFGQIKMQDGQLKVK